jgi:HD-GYP domain-containing protein (c-di-GMP phosphodiesterase class II)
MEHHSKPGKLTRIALTGAKALAVCVVLAAVTVLVSPFAALALVCILLWAALFVALRRLHHQSQSMDGYISSIQDQYDSIIGVLCGALNLRDDIKSFHTSRVSSMAAAVATDMGMRHEEIRLLQKAAVLADIGKIEIAESILSNTGDLSGQEWEEMKKHPELGHRILSGITHLADAGEIVLSHHERFDGQGYPRSLAAEDIPLAARIFAVVDAYTAMTSDRPHRKKMTHEMAIKEILRNSLTQFDPEVVRAFVRCEERGEIEGVVHEEETPPVPTFTPLSSAYGKTA